MSNQGFIVPIDGAQGPQGEPGDGGASAYDIAVANGFVGDEAAWLASLVGADGQDGQDGNDGAPGATGATGAAGPNTVTTSTTTNITGLIEGNGATIIARALGVGASTSVPTRADADSRYASRTAPYYIQVALSANGQAIAAGTKKGMCRVPLAGTITAFNVVCDPANEPVAEAVQCDLNTLNLGTGAATSVLSSVASIATSANASTGGAISGTPSVAVGDLLSIDIDQGSDGKELVATITITPT